MVTVEAGIDTGPVLRPAWLRLRFWVVVAVLLVVAAGIVSSLKNATTGPLDPSSSSKAGSKAVATLLKRYGMPVTRTTQVTTAVDTPAESTLVVAFPAAYSARQLEVLARSPARLVLVEPSERELAAVNRGVHGSDGVSVSGPNAPDCPAPGAVAAGTVDFPTGTQGYEGPGLAPADRCYGGAVVLGPTLAVIGSAALLRNDHLADDGVAALDVNVLSADRTTRRVVWLMPGSEATSAAAPTYWALFPDGARRAFLWLLLLGVLLALWRGRRFGPVVTEPLPVVVRSAEVVEGHGRLYRRAGARDRAATALRAGARYRLATHAGLQRGSGMIDVVTAAAALTGRVPTDLTHLLDGPPPVDDAALLRLAVDLDALEAAAGVPPRPKGNRT